MFVFFFQNQQVKYILARAMHVEFFDMILSSFNTIIDIRLYFSLKFPPYVLEFFMSLVQVSVWRVFLLLGLIKC